VNLFQNLLLNKNKNTTQFIVSSTLKVAVSLSIMAVIAINKKAGFEYKVLESFQAGLSLSGPMVKAIRAHRVTITGLFVVYQGGQLQIVGFGNESLRENVKLLLNPKEINEIAGKIREKGLTCVPLNIKTVGRWIKCEIAIVKGKNTGDKRETIKNREIDREVNREFKGVKL
jgi:SsrA-binding protein